MERPRLGSSTSRRALAMEWAPKVRVNCVSAGIVRTEVFEDWYGEAGAGRSGCVGAARPGRRADRRRRRRRLAGERSRELRQRRQPRRPRRRRDAGVLQALARVAAAEANSTQSGPSPRARYCVENGVGWAVRAPDHAGADHAGPAPGTDGVRGKPRPGVRARPFPSQRYARASCG